MQHSLEAYFLVNFAVDTLLIAIVARANESLRCRTVLFAGLLAASYALATKTVSASLRHPYIQLLLLILLSMILSGEYEFRVWGAIAVQLLGGAAMLGGVGSMASSEHCCAFTLLCAGLILVGILFYGRHRRLFSWEVTVLVSLKGRCVSFRALIDTGNRLREPISGLPVLIAQSDLLENLLMHLRIEDLPCRYVNFGALGGSGTVQCFRPDAVFIRRGSRLLRAPGVWVASYRGQIPGRARALAPPSFAVIPGKHL